MNLVANFFAGTFLFNAVPHLVAGLQGSWFQTPFAKPRGVGESSAMVNLVWGTANLVLALLLAAFSPLVIGFNAGFAAAVAGALAIGIYLAWHFGNVRNAGKGQSQH